MKSIDVRRVCPFHVAPLYVHGLILGLLMLLPMRSLAQFTYTNNPDGTVTLTRYNGSAKSVDVPATTNGLTVTTIGAGCFFGSTVTVVTLPETITTLRAGAFHYCNITNLFIPPGVTNIEGQLFGLTRNLVAVHVNVANPAYMSLEGVLYDKAGTTLITYPAAKPGSYSLANTTVQIAPGAFNECTGLTNVIIPAGVKELPNSVFRSCSALQTVTLKTGLQSIGTSAFYGCPNLTNIAFPISLTWIGSNAFNGCSRLTAVTIPASVTNIGVGAFSFAGLTNISVDPLNLFFSDQDGMLLSKDGGEFVRWSGGKVGTCTIPSTVTNIEVAAFEGSFVGLTNVIVPASVRTIPEAAFRGCAGLLGIQLPDELETISDWAFYGCESLTSVTLPPKVSHVGLLWAFVGCSALQAINASELNPNFASLDGVLFIKNFSKLVAFPSGKTGRYIIPTGVTTVGIRSFESSRLISVAIPSTVTNIETFAFFGCMGLTSITIPASVTQIGPCAFAQTEIKNAYFLGEPPPEQYIMDSRPRTIFYMPGAVGWPTNFAGTPTMLWDPRPDTSREDFGIRTNRFSFLIVGVTNSYASVVVEANTNLLSDTWVPVSTNRMNWGYSYFRDSGWTNSPNRYYRLRSAD